MAGLTFWGKKGILKSGGGPINQVYFCSAYICQSKEVLKKTGLCLLRLGGQMFRSSGHTGDENSGKR